MTIEILQYNEPQLSNYHSIMTKGTRLSIIFFKILVEII